MVLGALTPHYASDYSLFMAIVDLIPVALFFVAGLYLMKDLYNKLNKWNYALLSTGTILVLIAGLCKAIWKILAACAITDFVVFNLMMMPLQGIGFALAAVSLLELMKKGKYTKAMCFALPVAFMAAGEAPLEMSNSSMPFLIIQTLGGSLFLILLCIIAGRMKNKWALVLLIISFITMWGMGGLAAVQNKMDTSLWNWLEEIDNSLSQGTLLAGVLLLHKAGLSEEKIY